jgi:hypothetical protein
VRLWTRSLPAPVHLAAADESHVWCVSGRHVWIYGRDGDEIAASAVPEELGSLTAGGGTAVGATRSGVLVWLDARSGDVSARTPIGGNPFVVGGGDHAWAVDPTSGRAWHLPEPGALGAPLAVGGVDDAAPLGDRLWWTSRFDTLLRDGEREVDVGAAAGERGASVGCSGAIWISIHHALFRVGGWSADASPPIVAPEGPVRHLACAEGTLVGASGRQGLFTLNPAIDASIRHHDVDLGGELVELAAAGTNVWAFPAGRDEARVVALT